MGQLGEHRALKGGGVVMHAQCVCGAVTCRGCAGRSRGSTRAECWEWWDSPDSCRECPSTAPEYREPWESEWAWHCEPRCPSSSTSVVSVCGVDSGRGVGEEGKVREDRGGRGNSTTCTGLGGGGGGGGGGGVMMRPESVQVWKVFPSHLAWLSCDGSGGSPKERLHTPHA